jgi:hypothetical protein
MIRAQKAILAATFGIKCYRLATDEKLRLEQLQMKQIAEENQEMMNGMLLAEATKNQHTQEGSLILRELSDETKAMKENVTKYFAKELSRQLQHQAPSSRRDGI